MGADVTIDVITIDAKNLIAKVFLHVESIEELV